MTKPYLYYRLQPIAGYTWINLVEFYLYNTKNERITDYLKYSSSANSNFISGNGNSPFDNNKDTYAGFGGHIDAKNKFFQIKLEKPTSISSYGLSFTMDYGDRYYVSAWEIQGSNDGINWDILDHQENITDWQQKMPKYFVISENHEVSGRVWNFLGRLQNNGKDLIEDVNTEVIFSKDVQKPELDAQVSYNTLDIQLSLPDTYSSIGDEGVGKQTIINGESKNANNQSYGIYFNDYEANQSKGIYSAVFGSNNRGNYPYQFVAGKWNENKKEDLFEIGNGNDSVTRKNVFSVDRDGNAYVETDIVNKDGLSLKSLDEKKLGREQLEEVIRIAEPMLLMYNNEAPITVGDLEEVQIVNLNYITTESTYPYFLATIPFTMDRDGYVTFTYYVDGVKLSDKVITQYYHAGKNFATLSVIFSAESNNTGNFILTMRTKYVESAERVQGAKIEAFEKYLETGKYEPRIDTTAPTAAISLNAISAYLYVQGLGLTAAWNGKIKYNDDIKLIKLQNVPKKIKTLAFTAEPEITLRIPVTEPIENKVSLIGLNVLSSVKIMGVKDELSEGSPKLE